MARNSTIALNVTMCMMLLALTTVLCHNQRIPRSPPRATLHELLLRNKNIASIGTESVTTEALPIPANQNRRVLILGEAKEPPNYVDYNTDKGFDYADTIDNGRYWNADDPSRPDLTPGHKDPAVGVEVTAYATPGLSVDAPSYADPSLLAAVMSQADAANFRFPSDKPKIILARKNQTQSQNAPIELTANLKTNAIDPFELFPPTFHDLLEIPLHTYPNGSTFSPHQRPKIRPSRPLISDGYANTNINGQESIIGMPLQNKDNPQPSGQLTKNTRIRRPFQERLKPIENTSIKEEEKQILGTDPNPRDDSDFNRNSIRDTLPNRLPPLTESSLRRRPTRPSLRFRARTPSHHTTTTPLKSTIPLGPLTRTSTAISEMPTFSSKKPVLGSFNRSSHLSPFPNFNPNSQVKNNPIEYLPSDRIALQIEDDDRQLPPLQNPYREEIDASTERPKYNSVHDNQRHFDHGNKPTIIKLENIYSTLEESSPTSKKDESDFSKILESYQFPDLQKIDSLASLDEDPKETTSSKKPLPDFKPSKVDPFYGNLPFVDHIAHADKTIVPTTFRPAHFLQGHNKPQNVIPTTVRPPILFSHNLNHKVPTANFHYENNFGKKETPFNNFHTLRTSHFVNNKNPLLPERQNAYLERDNPTIGSENQGSQNGAHIIPSQYHKFDQQGVLNRDFRLPNGVFRSQAPPNLEFPFRNTFPSRRRIRRPVQRRRPSFFEKLGFFRSKKNVNRRSGETGSGAEVNDIVLPLEKDNIKPHVDYVLSNGPLPFNGKKVVVLGPFKEPPIGAPRIFATNQVPIFTNSHASTQLTSRLMPPSPLAYPEKLPERDPSFKVVNLPKTSNKIIYTNATLINRFLPKHANVSAKFDLDRTLPHPSAHSYRKSSLVSAKSLKGSSVPLVNSKLTTSSRSSGDSTRFSSYMPLEVNHKNYGLFKEVSHEDKERLIAAKFVFPQKPSVQRSGISRQIIPIPVPMMTPNGKQVSSFHRIQMPHIPIVRKLGKSQTKKSLQSFSPPLVSRSKTIDHVKAARTIVPPSNHHNITRITPLTKISIVRKEKRHEKPQSYQEPSVSELKFGGWNAVGDSPVVGYVKENTPTIEFKEEKKPEGLIKVDQSKISDGASQKETKDLDDARSQPPSETLVRFSSELNVEAPEVVRSYLVDPPNKI